MFLSALWSIAQTTDDACVLKHTVERNAQLKMRERAGWLRSARAQERKAFNRLEAGAYQAALLLAPYYPCWYSLSKRPSVTVQHDGGKVLCGMREIASRTQSPCTVVSIGSNFDRGFEDELDTMVRGRCKIHIFDPTMNGTHADRMKLRRWMAALPRNYRFHAVGAVGSNRSRTFEQQAPLPELLRRTGGGHVDVLKFDIDGYESDLLDEVDWGATQAGLIVFELHSNMIAKVHGQPYLMPQLERHLALLEAAGYRLYSVEPVHAHRYCPPPRCADGVGQAELAFIHKNWDPRTGKWDGGGCFL